MDNASWKESEALISSNIEFQSTSQYLTKSSICKSVGFKKILLILAILQVLGIWYLYNVNYQRNGTDHFQETVSSSDAIYKADRVTNTIFHLPLTRPADMSKYYEETDEEVWCLTSGVANDAQVGQTCSCLRGFSGSDCGVPLAIWDSGFLKNGTAKGVKVRRREQPRRLVYTIWLENDAEAIKRLCDCLKVFQDIVDVFIIGRYRNFHNPSWLPFPEIVKKFHLSFASAKMIYMPLSPNERNVPVAQYELWKSAKTLLSDVRTDDLVIMSDVFHVPNKDVLLFMKLYDGFGEPVFFYTQDIPAFTNSSTSTLSQNIAACTVEFLRYLCNYDARLVWLHLRLNDKIRISQFESRMANSKFSPWEAGSSNTPAGARYSLIDEKRVTTALKHSTIAGNDTKLNQHLEPNVTLS